MLSLLLVVVMLLIRLTY